MAKIENTVVRLGEAISNVEKGYKGDKVQKALENIAKNKIIAVVPYRKSGETYFVVGG